ncbi:hypothetical protein AB0K92_15940 [Streptomyces sp. NPDC052687]|uniref:hypothetical protein n=1 Tax=Streptomyces sp. NPDC052687 TaxID=3154759 RepID=UPI0034435C23
MKQAVIEFSGTVTVYPGEDYEGGEMSLDDARGWLSTALSRGDKHAWQYLTSGGVTSVSYEECDEEE